MKVYLATAGEPGEYDFEVVGVFAKREDAKSFPLASRVEEWDVDEAPVSLRIRYTVTWDVDLMRAPTWKVESVPARGSVPALEQSPTSFATWDREKARALFDGQTALYWAARDRRAAELVASLGRVDVKVWYEPGDGKAALLTPLHSTKHAFMVPRDRVTDQAGLPRNAYLHGQWFTVKTCTFTEVDGFSVCSDPNTSALAEG